MTRRTVKRSSYGAVIVESVVLLADLGAGTRTTLRRMRERAGVCLSRFAVETWTAETRSRERGLEEDVPGYDRAKAEAYRDTLRALIERKTTCPHCGKKTEATR